ncbi:MAG: crossover junction endodeoxyribonuclease RuvC [Anaerolineae bacterium]|nr:crossover junction endodeoxyribonuclease RuvC [Thermoflexales bacterium]MDW8408045.1 crossover junction endodeoxyribonuclease RuvC [Anaerolineae bacterium]
MITLGIDPGIATTGFGIVCESEKGDLTALAYGVIETPKTDPLPRRLVLLRQQLIALIEQWRPTACAVEALFFASNAKTAMTVGQARGVALVTVCEAGLSIGEYTPLQVKQAVAGYGQADKKQMQTMVKLLLHLDRLPKPDDAADALAVAITHIHTARHADLARA